LKKFALLVGLFCVLNFQSVAKNYDDSLATSDEIKHWYATVVQNEYPSSCCGEADAYWADGVETSKDGEYVAVVTDERDIPNRAVIPVGTRIPIPNDKLDSKNQGNPSGHGVIFVKVYTLDPQNVYVYCYFPPALF
jgi:hypothetical protein